MVLVLIFNFFELLSDIVRNRIPLVTVGEYLANVTPYWLYLFTPLCVLLAVLVTFGLMQKSNEITAMKASGVSIYRAVLPVLVISGLLAGALFLMEESYLPYANKRQETLRNTIKEKPAQTYLRPDRKWIFGEHNTIYYYEFFDPDREQFGSISAFEFEPKSFRSPSAFMPLRRTGRLRCRIGSLNAAGNAPSGGLPFRTSTRSELILSPN
jgi:lipopolysaccharide export LptBFGC system permease protein LptF